MGWKLHEFVLIYRPLVKVGWTCSVNSVGAQLSKPKSFRSKSPFFGNLFPRKTSTRLRLRNGLPDSRRPSERKPGLLEYRVKIPSRLDSWLTEIKYLRKGFRRAMVGPISFAAVHRLETVEEGTKMTDEITTKCPLHPWLDRSRSLRSPYFAQDFRLSQTETRRTFPPVPK